MGSPTPVFTAHQTSLQREINHGSDPKSGRKLVFKVDGSVPPEDIYATTYQMRISISNFATDSVISRCYDYIQGIMAAVTMMKVR